MEPETEVKTASIPPSDRWKLRAAGVIGLTVVVLAVLVAGGFEVLDGMTVAGICSACISAIVALVRGRVDGAAMLPTAVGLGTYLAGGVALMLVMGCGSAQVPMETARIAACESAETAIEARYEAHEIDRATAFAEIDGVRAVCDELHAQIVGDQGGAQP